MEVWFLFLLFLRWSIPGSRSSPSQHRRVTGGWFRNTPHYSSFSWLNPACLRECCGRPHMAATDACVVGRMIKFSLGAVFVIYFFSWRVTEHSWLPNVLCGTGTEHPPHRRDHLGIQVHFYYQVLSNPAAAASPEPWEDHSMLSRAEVIRKNKAVSLCCCSFSLVPFIMEKQHLLFSPGTAE